ncbi:MAG TPA: MBOAT family protein [Gemmataceae bacterium]|nr:MBOAT family protein [Gemmataceae bacterium]
MLFHTYQYLIFFVAVGGLYWSLPWPRARVYLLVAASFVFYSAWNEWLALLVAGTATLDFLLALRIESARTTRGKKLLVWLSVAVNLGVLGYFKYANFFLDSLQAALHRVGVESPPAHLNLIVPFGISFYTFEAISYTVDVYRGRLRAERNLANFLLFILFFPHLVAGPIVRGRDFLGQVPKPKRWSWVRAQAGVQLIALGLFKKLAIADCMAIYSDPAFGPRGDAAALSSAHAWMALLAFAVRVYCDFSAYSDMARGSAHLLGYKLPPNFNLPYLAVNIADFWRRWHISLSNWLRDYVFIPLGGSRGGEYKTARNLVVTFALGGLWHGATWGWVAWGVLHGVLLVLHRVFRRWCDTRPKLKALVDSPLGTGGRIVVTLFVVVLTMAFAQPHLDSAVTLMGRLFAFARGAGLPMDENRLWWTLIGLAAGHVVVAAGAWAWLARRLPGPALGTGCALVFVAAQLMSPDTTRVFVYFQF